MHLSSRPTACPGLVITSRHLGPPEGVFGAVGHDGASPIVRDIHVPAIRHGFQWKRLSGDGSQFVGVLTVTSNAFSRAPKQGIHRVRQPSEYVAIQCPLQALVVKLGVLPGGLSDAPHGTGPRDGEENKKKSSRTAHGSKKRRTPHRCRAGSLKEVEADHLRTTRAVAVRSPWVSFRMCTSRGRPLRSIVPSWLDPRHPHGGARTGHVDHFTAHRAGGDLQTVGVRLAGVEDGQTAFVNRQVGNARSGDGHRDRNAVRSTGDALGAHNPIVEEVVVIGGVVRVVDAARCDTASPPIS